MVILFQLLKLQLGLDERVMSFNLVGHFQS